MSKIYKADIAEKIILSGESLQDLSSDSFKIGGKIIFDDLSSIKCVGNISFLEKQIPQGLISHEYIEIKSLKIEDDTKKIIDNINKKEGIFKTTALRVEPTHQEQAESDYRSIVFFHNGECAVEDFHDNSYHIYDKYTANTFYSSFNLDSNLILRKLNHDLEEKNNLKVDKNKKFKI